MSNGNTILELKNVTKRFGGLVAVNNVSFKVREKEFLGLIGPNGAGKTTLFNCISGLYKPNGGKIIFKGIDITGWPPHKIAMLGIARTFQIVRPLSNLTVLENVAIGALKKTNDTREAISKAKEILEIVGLYDKRYLKARLLNVIEKKRLELARALATDPELLLLDEVAAGLTPAEVDELLELLRDIHRRGLTIIMIEHVMRAIMNIAERIIVLHYGRLIAEGPPEAISKNPKVIEAYLGGSL